VFENRLPRVVDWLPVFRSHAALERIELRRGHVDKSGFTLHLAVRIERAKSKLAISVECRSASYWNPKPEALFAEFPVAAAPTLAIRYFGNKPDQLPDLRKYVAGLAKRFEQVDVG